MKNRIRLYSVIFIIFLSSCTVKKVQENKIEDVDYGNYGKYIRDTKKPQKFETDLIADEKTAINIAEIIWGLRYNYVKDERRMPYNVILEEGKIWYVKTNLPKGFMGEVLHIKINKYDGKILYVWSEM